VGAVPPAPAITMTTRFPDVAAPAGVTRVVESLKLDEMSVPAWTTAPTDVRRATPRAWKYVFADPVCGSNVTSNVSLAVRASEMKATSFVQNAELLVVFVAHVASADHVGELVDAVEVTPPAKTSPLPFDMAMPTTRTRSPAVNARLEAVRVCTAVAPSPDACSHVTPAIGTYLPSRVE